MTEPHEHAITYRLGEYKLIAYDSVLLWWEKHAPLGEQCRGRCFVLGDVLIIGHQISRETGYLIGEFLEQLEKLPAWNKTRYYCLASGLMDVITGNNLTNDFFEQRLSLVNMSGTGLNSDIRVIPGNFKLRHYQITVTAKGELSWQKHQGVNRITGGECVIESGILFIGEQQYDKAGEHKQEFFARLHQLPQWEQTVVWGHDQALRACRQEQQTKKQHAAIRQRAALKKHPINENPGVTFHKRHEVKAKRLLLPGFKQLKTVWRRMPDGKVLLKYLIPLILAGPILAFYAVKEKFHPSHRHKEHHHGHDD